MPAAVPEFHREYLVRLPLPLAQLYSRAFNAKEARARHDNAFYLFESIIKLAAAPAIAAYLAEVQHGAPRVAALDRLLAQLALPSLGQWVAMLRELARHFGQRPDAAAHPLGHVWGQLNPKRRDLPAIVALYRRIKNGPDGEPAGDQSCSLLDLLDGLVQYRNGVFGHGAGRFNAFYEQEMGPLLLPAASELLAEGVWDLLGPHGSRLVYLTELRSVDQGHVQINLMELVGRESERMTPQDLSTEQAAGLVPNCVAVQWPGRKVPLRLDPLLVFRGTELAEEVLFLNRDRNGRQAEYLSYTTGRTERDRLMGSALAKLLSQVAGRDVSESELQKFSEQSLAETPSVEALFGPGPPTANQVGDYEILAEIGRGGMGVVCLVRQLSLGRLVAMKMLPADLAADEVALARFRREMRALGRCEHPHIVKVLSNGTLPDGRLYYTMEYVPGADLEMTWRELSGPNRHGAASSLGGTTWSKAVVTASRKQREVAARHAAESSAASGGNRSSESPGVGTPGLAPNADDAPAAPILSVTVAELPLPPLPELPSAEDDPGGYTRRVAQLIRDAALALQAVHEQGIVHRDVKPANLMLTPDGRRVVLMDFGLAKGQSMSMSASKAGGLLGTLRYAAPEQLAAASIKVGATADVRGLGVTLWELLTRERLFGEAEDEQQLAAMVHDRDLPRLRSVDPTLDVDLEAIAARATERRAADRIQTARQLAEYLQLYLDGKPIPIRPPNAAELLRRWLREHKGLVGTAAAAATAIVLTVTIAFISINQQRKRAERLADKNATLALKEKEAQSRLQVAVVKMQTAAGLVAAERDDPATAALWFGTAAGLSPDDETKAAANRLKFQIWSRMAPQIKRALIHPWDPNHDTRQPWTGSKRKWKGTISNLLPNKDGRQLLSRSASSGLWALWNAQTGKRLTLPHDEEGISTACWNESGDFLAWGTPLGRCMVTHRPDFKVGVELPPGEPVTQVGLSREGRWLAVARGSTVQVRDLSDLAHNKYFGETIKTPKDVQWLVFDSGGTRLAVASADTVMSVDGASHVTSVNGAVRIYQLNEHSDDPQHDAVKLIAGPLPNYPTVYQPLSHVAPVWVDHDRGLLTCFSKDIVCWWDADAGKTKRLLNLPTWDVNSILVSPDKKYLAINGRWGTQIFDSESGAVVGLITASSAHCVAFSSDSKTLMVGSGAGAVSFWSVPSGRFAGNLPLSDDEYAVSFLGNDIVTSAIGGVIQVWKPAERIESLFNFHDYPVPHSDSWRIDYTQFLDSDGRYLLSKSDRNGACVIDLKDGRAAGPILPEIGDLFMVVFVPSSSTVAVQTQGQKPDTIRNCDWRTGKTIWGPVSLPSPGYSIAVSPDGRRLVSMCADRALLLDTNTGNTVATFVHKGEPDLVNNMPLAQFSPDGRLFVTYRAWKTVVVWDGQTATQRFAFRHEGPATTISFSKDSRYLATGSDDQEARVFDLDTGKELAKLDHASWVTDTCFSKDGRLLLTTCDRQGSARLWDWRARKLVCPPMSREGNAEVCGVYSGIFLPDALCGNLWLATNAVNQTPQLQNPVTRSPVQLWDSATGSPIAPALPMISCYPGRSLRCCLGGSKLASFDRTGLVRIFDLSVLARDNPYGLAADQLRQLAELQAMQTINDSAVARITTEGWLQRWNALYAERPDYFDKVSSEPPNHSGADLSTLALPSQRFHSPVNK